MSDVGRVWEVLEVFSRYAWYEKATLIVAVMALPYLAYVFTVGRPPLVQYKVTIRPAHLMTEHGSVNAEGHVTILWLLGNDTQPPREMHNLKAEISTNNKYLIHTSPPATREKTFRGETTVYHDLWLPILHKNDGGKFLEWKFRVPEANDPIKIRYSAVTSETDWQHGSWSVVNNEGEVKLEPYPIDPPPTPRLGIRRFFGTEPRIPINTSYD